MRPRMLISITTTDYTASQEMSLVLWRETNFSEVDVASITSSSWSKEHGKFKN